MAALGGAAGVASAVSTAAGLVGTVMQARGTIAAGKAQQQAAEYKAAQQDIKAKEEQAAAQKEGQQYRRQKELALSELQAKSAASGFTATDPTSLALADEIARYGTYQEQLAQYGGKSRRAGLEAQAKGTRMTGRAAAQGAKHSAAGTIASGIGSIAGKYAKNLRGGGSRGGSNLRYATGYG